MSARPQLRLLNTETGEVTEDERDVLIEQLKSELAGKSMQIGKLKKELRELRAVEPEHQEIREVLTYCSHRVGRNLVITPAGKRWEKVRTLLRMKLDDRPPFTVDELKLAADGALLDPWINGTAPKAPKDGRYLDPVTIYRDEVQVERLRDLALGFKAKTSVVVGELVEVVEDLQLVNLPFLLRFCCCTHRRIEHSSPDPERGGQEGCLIPDCPCTDYEASFLLNEAA